MIYFNLGLFFALSARVIFFSAFCWGFVAIHPHFADFFAFPVPLQDI